MTIQEWTFFTNKLWHDDSGTDAFCKQVMKWQVRKTTTFGNMSLKTSILRHETKDTPTKCDNLIPKRVKEVRTPHPKKGAYRHMTQNEPWNSSEDMVMW